MGHSLGHMPPSTSNNFIFGSLWSKSDSQLSKYCIVCEISWCRCQQLTALSISTALVTKLLVIEQLLHPALKSAVSVPWRNLQLCPSSQQILATSLIVFVAVGRSSPLSKVADVHVGHGAALMAAHAAVHGAAPSYLTNLCVSVAQSSLSSLSNTWRPAGA